MFENQRSLTFGLMAAALFFAACDEDPEPNAPAPNRDAGFTGGDAGVDGDSGLEADATIYVADSGVFDTGAPKTGVGVLGWNSHVMTEVDVLEISGGGLRTPRDLAFNPDGDHELWVVSRIDDSTVTYFHAGFPDQTQIKKIDPFAMHFMEEPSSLAFGAPNATYGNLFGTCQESRNTYNGMAAQNDFMGPSLWPSLMSIYGESNPAAVAAVGFDLGSHLDMLHQSPLCMGIAWDTANVYWTFDGLTGSISRYDFLQDHRPGYDDHSDGIIRRYVTGLVARVADVPSHMILDHATGLLYIADTGNARIAVLDTNSGVQGRSLRVVEAGTTLHQWDDAVLTTLVDMPGGELSRPSGIELFGDMIFVTDNGTSRITAFDKTTGARLDWLDTGLPAGSLMGIVADPEGRLYFVDAVGNKVQRLTARP